MHQWRIRPGSGNDDLAAFAEWSEAYRKKTQGDVDAARLPDLMAQHIPKKPSLLVTYGFEMMPPQTAEFLAHFEHAFCAPDPMDAQCVRTPYPSAKHELEAAAKWARARLEEGKTRIGVVVPDLGKRRAEVVRVFSRVMQPGYNLPGAANTPMPFNVSVGKPLHSYPLVGAALKLVELAHKSVAFPVASYLIRSPFLAHADTELSRRATLDAKLRKDFSETVSLAKLIAAAQPAPLLRKTLERMFEISTAKPETPAEWARHFSALLEAAGFPGERTPDSEEFQTRAKWHEALSELAKLERIAGRFSFDDALAFLTRHCADTLFQAESPDAPVQILGVLESAGLRFDCLWVSGLTDEAWPLAARPNPFLPIAAQKKAGIPQASAETAAAYDRSITEGWMRAAQEVVFSWPQKEEDRDLAPSALIAHVIPAQAGIQFPDYARYRDLLFASRKLESFEDHKGPPVAPGKVRGGTRVLADQAACPFRAFARWRLGTEELEEPEAGLDARDRGTLVHALMRELWTRLRGSAALKENLAPIIARSAAAAVKEMGLEGRFAELERERLAKLAREWLELESRRVPFEVLHVEQQRAVQVAGLEFVSRIDRMDKLVEGEMRGSHVLIDYKTAKILNVRQWEGPRPDDPQLPLYAVAAPEQLAAVTFAKTVPGDMKFIGQARANGVLPKVKAHENWPQLVAAWKKDAEALGAAFAAGEAHVDPKNDLKTCRRCDLQTLCRVYEKVNALKGEP